MLGKFTYQINSDNYVSSITINRSDPEVRTSMFLPEVPGKIFPNFRDAYAMYTSRDIAQFPIKLPIFVSANSINEYIQSEKMQNVLVILEGKDSILIVLADELAYDYHKQEALEFFCDGNKLYRDTKQHIFFSIKECENFFLVIVYPD